MEPTTCPMVPRVASPDTVERWWQDGFAAVDLPVTRADLDEAGALLGALFARWPDLPAGHAQDVGEGPVGVPEVVMPSRLSPALLRTRVYRAMRDVAADLLSGPVRHHFDHAIAKPPGAPATAWHQDVAFDPGHDVPMATVWLPLVDVDEYSGAMQFATGSHRGAILEHVAHGPRGRRAAAEPLLAEVCAVHAGTCTVHHARTLHGSTANAGPCERVAWIVKFVPERRSVVRRVIAERVNRRRPVVSRPAN
jgi:hypothetical protein